MEKNKAKCTRLRKPNVFGFVVRLAIAAAANPTAFWKDGDPSEKSIQNNYNYI